MKAKREIVSAVVNRTERGWPAHFICASRCAFRRNTLLERGTTRIIVSTVGSMRVNEEKEPTEIGAGRYYETMAFKARWEEPYWDADVSEEINFTSPWQITECEHKSDHDANEMHEAVVTEIATTMGLSGDFT